MSHKNDSPKLTQKVLWSIKGLVVDLSVYLISLVVSIHGRPQASIAAIFRQSGGYVFSCRLQRCFFNPKSWLFLEITFKSSKL